MPAVIKAADHNLAIAGVAFNLDDVRANAEAYLAKVREQAVQLLTTAQRDATTIREHAQREGFQAGQQQAAALIEQQVASQLATVLPALRTAIGQIEAAKPGWLAHWERRAVHLACAIAERVIRRRLGSHAEVAADLLRESLNLAAGRSRVRIMLNPGDFQALGTQVNEIVAASGRTVATEVAPEPSITPGGCRIETEHGTIDQQFAAQLARIEEELT